MRGRPPKLHLSRTTCIWVDADSCPAAARDWLFATADSRRVVLTLVSTKSRQWPNSAFIRSIVVSAGFDGVSQRIQQLALEGDVVVSTDAQVLRDLGARKIKALQPNDTRELTRQLEQHLTQLEQQAFARSTTPQRKTGTGGAAVSLSN